VDEEGFRVVKSKDAGRFLTARNGDHLMTEFHCPLCQFRNVNEREPSPVDAMDQLLMEVYIPRAIFDGFWSRETSTVNGNRLDFDKMLKSHIKFGMVRALPRLGPKPLADNAEMSCAISLLDRSLDPGKNEDTVQYGTA
jgi:hypothetical protein